MLLSTAPLAHAQAPAAQQQAAARRFLAQRGLASHEAPASARALAEARASFQRRRAEQRTQTTERGAQSQLAASLQTNWISVGPVQTLTPAYGAVTGRVTSVVVDASDATGNTVYLGTTGGGVWKSTNAAGPASKVVFSPITDDAPPSPVGVSSLSIGAVSVQPGGGVVLAGTGDPNDALDSYFGSGILRSTDHGATWTTVTEANIGDYASLGPYSFYGEGFSGFAWSSVTSGLVVAGVTQAYDGEVVNAAASNSLQGLYYSADAGATWSVATITDGPGQVLQSPATPGGYSGMLVTAVVWNPVRRAFYAAIRAHGYYSSADGVTWTRLVHQPGPNLNTQLCPLGYAGGSVSCPVFRGALAVQPGTGDIFAITVDRNLVDQGIWRDVCSAVGGNCSTGSTVTFATQVPDAELQDGTGRIVQGDYDLWLAAVPSGGDTLLYAGTVDIFARSLTNSNAAWRNTTNVATCAAARVAPSQHAVATGPAGLMYFGNDGGLWRTVDGVGQQQATCSADDAAHFQNLNPGLGSLAEVTGVAQSPGSDTTLLVGLGVNGSAATTTAKGAWPQVMAAPGGYVAIDPASVGKWYVTSGPGVSISSCGRGGTCDAAAFAGQATLGDAQTDSDGRSLGEPAVWMLDPQDTTRMLIGTCRVWRGAAPGEMVVTAADAVSPVLDDATEPDCSEGEGQIQSLGASGTIAGSGAKREVLYAGMEGVPPVGGFLPYGGLAAGHVFTATVGEVETTPAEWTDTFASPVLNDEANQGQFNPGGFGISSVTVDPHDVTGHTVYATVQGFNGNGISEPVLYRSTDQGQNWTNITANLPAVPVNALVVDPGNANIVYLATDAGVYATVSVTKCATGGEQCWSPYGIGLPNVPVTTLATDGTANDGLLIAGTYGRGVWEMVLANGQTSTTGDDPATDLLSTTALHFAAQIAGTASAAQTVTITNTGDLPLTLITAAASLSDYRVNAFACATNVPGHQTCAISVVFAPVQPGLRTGKLTITDSLHYGGSALVVTLNGTGLPPSGIGLFPTAFDFGAQGVGSASTEQDFTLTNESGLGLTGLVFGATGDFAVKGGTCAAVLATGSSCTLQLTFAPETTGTRSGSLTVSGNRMSKLTTALSGVGLSFALSAPNPVTQTVVTGTTASYLVRITTEGGNYPAGALATLALTCSGAAALPAGSACAANPANVQITAGATASVTITVTTPALATTARERTWRSGWELALLAPVMVYFRRRSRVAFSLLVCMVAVVGGCGVTATGGSKINGTGTTGGGIPSSFALTLAASAPGIRQSTQMTLVLEQ